MDDQRSATGRRGGRASGVRALWSVLLWFTLAAFAWQGFLTQTHRHSSERGYSPGVTLQAIGGAEAKKGGQAPPVGPDNCPICQEIAHGGAYLASAPIALDVPVALAAWFTVTLLLALALRQQSHAWRSRAPPLCFQA